MIPLLKFLARLPLPLLHALGALLGWAIYLAPGRHSRRLRDNLAASGLCADCRPLLRASVAEAGKAVIEAIPMWLAPLPRTLGWVRAVHGLDAVDAALAAQRGVIVIAPHLGCFELINLYFAARGPFTALYKPARKPALDALMRQGRERGQAKLVPTDLSGVRALLAALKRGEAVGILPDQVASGGDGVWAYFFGQPAYTPTLAASLRTRTGAAAFYVVAARLPRGRGYELHLVPAGDFPPDKTAAAVQINRGVEAMVRRFPAQYMWTYNRYKRPGDAPPPPAA